MKRRTLLGGAGALALARPALVRAAGATRLRFIPQADLTFLDPHSTPANITRNYAAMVFDTLYGLDGNFQPQPQMVEGHTIESDGKLWTLKLRSGLFWHDGTPVLARDCVASVRRWSKRDQMGETLMSVTDELSAPDDTTLVFRLRTPFPLLPDALAKCGGPMSAMMPERLATTDPFKPIPEIIGSGPFRYKIDERLQGSRNVFEKFEKYVPRPDGSLGWTSGPKVVHFDRVEWTTIPDVSTSAAALMSGEQDWFEWAPLDLLQALRRDRKISVSVPDPTGWVEMMRINQLQPPFNNPAIRRALWGAIDQTAFMQAVSDDPTMYHVPLGFFGPGTAMASEAGLEPLKGPRDLDRVKRELKAAGYNGERVVLLSPTDYPTTKAMADVAADMMGRVGMNVDHVVTDWGTLLQRRASKAPVDKGGWSAFVTTFTGLDWINPATHLALRANGEAGWPGWASSPKLEALRQDWFAAPDLAHQKTICEAMQRQAMEDVPYYPFGQRYQPTAIRNDRLSGVNPGFPTFWNIKPV